MVGLEGFEPPTHRAMKMIGECGVVEELKNRLSLFLSGLSKDHGEPVSVVVKGSTSAGKSNLVGATIAFFPPESVSTRASMSKQALACGKDSLEGKILYFYEYRGAKDAQFLIRLQQSEGIIAHEFATVAGQKRSTKVSQRIGFPVTWTTTTQVRVYADDETRNLSLAVDESPAQTLAIVQAQIKGKTKASKSDLLIWYEAIRLLGEYKVSVLFPNWLMFVATELPLSQVRVRRDWRAFLALCKIITICRCWSDSKQRPKEITFNFPDDCIAYRILATAFASTSHGLREQELSIANAVKKLYA